MLSPQLRRFLPSAVRVRIRSRSNALRRGSIRAFACRMPGIDQEKLV